MNYDLNDNIILKKNHPCGSDTFKVIRLGADIKIKCIKCDRVIMIPRIELNKRIKKVIKNDN